MRFLSALALVLATVAPVAAADLWAVWVQQATLDAHPVPDGQVNLFTLGTPPARVAVLVDGAPAAFGPVPGDGTAPVPAGACVATDLGGFGMVRCQLAAPLEAGQIVRVLVDRAGWLGLVTYGEAATFWGLIRMWGLQKL